MNLTSAGRSSEQWDLVIHARRRWWDINVRELWRARDLLVTFVKRDFVAFYMQTLLGPAWHVFQPLATTLAYVVIFDRIAGLPTDGAPPFVFYLTGTVLWSYFSGCLLGTANTLVANAFLFSKVYFPRLVVPASVIASRLIAFVIQFAFLLVCLGSAQWSGGANSARLEALFVVPAVVLAIGALALGFGLLVSASTARYRDLQQVVTFGVQLVMYATPVIYPLSFVTGRYRDLIALNPLVPLFELFRWSLTGSGSWSALSVGYAASVTAAVLLGGILLFSRTESTFVDTV